MSGTRRIDPDPPLPPELSGWCWTVMREPDSRWSLRRRYWLTAELSDPVQISDRPLGRATDALDYFAATVGDIDQWFGASEDDLTDARYESFRIVMRAARRAA